MAGIREIRHIRPELPVRSRRHPDVVGSSIVLGALLSLPIAVRGMSQNKIASWAAYIYIYLFRGTR